MFFASNRTAGSPPQQAPVSLAAIDGEQLSGVVQSNLAGNGYWTRKSRTAATGWTGPNPLGGTFAGFDDPTFLLIGVWLMDFSGTDMYSRLADLGITAMTPAAGSITLANNVTYGLATIVDPADFPGGTISSGDDPTVVGMIGGEEPGSAAAYDTIQGRIATWAGTSDGPGRLTWVNYADTILNGDLEGVYTPADMATSADFITCDQYWCAGATSAFKLHFRVYGLEGDATADQFRRGCHYGSMLDAVRKEWGAGESRPLGMFVENGAPYEEDTSYEITPRLLVWAVWSTLVHGARSIMWFNHTFRTGDPGVGSNNFGNGYYGGPGVAGTGIYAAAKLINRAALALAPVLNSPLDGYFAYGDSITGAIGQPGFLTAVTSTNSRGPYGGVDASCRWRPSEGKHYILASTRESDTAVDVPVTFRMVDQGQTSAYEVFSDRTVSITRGGAIPDGFCELADTFDTAGTPLAYRIT